MAPIKRKRRRPAWNRQPQSHHGPTAEWLNQPSPYAHYTVQDTRPDGSKYTYDIGYGTQFRQQPGERSTGNVAPAPAPAPVVMIPAATAAAAATGMTPVFVQQQPPPPPPPPYVVHNHGPAVQNPAAAQRGCCHVAAACYQQNPCCHYY